MSVLERYPAMLPLPLLAGHSYTLKAPVLPTKMQSGHKRKRRLFKNYPIEMPVKFLYSSDQLAVFEYWFDEKINAGANRFILPVLTALGLTIHIAEFDGGYKAAAKTTTKWNVSAKVELQKINYADAGVMDLLVGLGYSTAEVNALLIAAEKAANESNLAV